MVYFKEDRLDEMARFPVSADGELPFKIVINIPDHQPPHAHVLDKETGKNELGQFLLSVRPPAAPHDIKDFGQGITDDMRCAICKWARDSNKRFKKYRNWDALNLIFGVNKN